MKQVKVLATVYYIIVQYSSHLQRRSTESKMETLPPLLEDLASQLESYLLHPQVCYFRKVPNPCNNSI